MLSLSRALGRRLFSSSSAAASDATAAAAAVVRKAQNPLEEFFEVERSTEEDKPPPHYVSGKGSGSTEQLPETRHLQIHSVDASGRLLTTGAAVAVAENSGHMGAPLLTVSLHVTTLLLLSNSPVSQSRGENVFAVTGPPVTADAALPTSSGAAPSANSQPSRPACWEEVTDAGGSGASCINPFPPTESQPTLKSSPLNPLASLGRSWKASELRLKSWDDLQKLWYVLLKEKNMLMSQRQMLHSENMRFPNPERVSKVKKSMCRIKHVLTERAIAEPDPRRSAEMKRMINAL
ncbi:hypothetical protein OsI_21467 [Oryza sativa Indica Group]|uniref:Large ribosomal subunit protein uL29m n=2 Tax=Oryza sativa TaxID=4530 RepID=B9FRB0_ORYSJ|nr:hypothetical protein OsI_21467 [Oryza sativa Indica Group]EEE65021.1 hypothetical protein OsJ_19975 [Oryza sativa Japonica Group]